MNVAPLPTAAPYLATKLGELDTKLGETLPRVLGKADEEAIHDMRVAIRRLRVILKLARPIFGRFLVDAVRGGFTTVHRATGELRDEEVLEETLAKLPVRDRAFVEWRTRRKARERTLRNAVLRRLKAGELDRARTLLEALVILPVNPKKDRDLSRFARKCVERARDGVEKLRDVPTTDVVGLHDLRIAYKNLRYACEILETALPLDLAAQAKPAATFQKILGEIHDVDVAHASIMRARGLPPRTVMKVLAALAARRGELIVRYESEMSPQPAGGAALRKISTR
jgi:CHAD domain-containing protein